MAEIKFDMPVAFQDLKNPFRYKAYASGRGAGKSWSFASQLIAYALQNENLLICCCREVQKSIANSVHRLLKNRIDSIGARKYFRVLKNSIICPSTGSEFIFVGLRDEQAMENIKSLEAVNICWVEEAHTLSENSLDILIPTIRAPGSEIWFSMNPRFPSDPVWQMFFESKEKAPRDSIVKMVSWRDNKDFGKELIDKMAWDKKFHYARYKHIWEGALQTTEGNIIKRKWFKRWNPDVPEKYSMLVISADTALSEKTSADYSVLELWGMSKQGLDLLDLRRGQWGYPELLDQIKAFNALHNNKLNPDARFKAPMGPLVIESKVSGISLLQSLKFEGYKVLSYDPRDKSKLRRVLTTTPYIQMGHVRVPPDGYDIWVEDFIAECTAFSDSLNHAYDDQVDAMTCIVQIWRNTFYNFKTSKKAE